MTRSGDGIWCKLWGSAAQGVTWAPWISQWLESPQIGMTRLDDGRLLVANATPQGVSLRHLQFNDDLSVTAQPKFVRDNCLMPTGTEAIASWDGKEFFGFGFKSHEDVDSPTAQRFYWRGVPESWLFSSMDEYHKLNFPCTQLHAADFVAKDAVELWGTVEGTVMRSILNVQTGETTTPQFIALPPGLSAMATTFLEVTGGNRTELRLLIRVSSVPATSGDTGKPKVVRVVNQTGKVLRLRWLNRMDKQDYGSLYLGEAKSVDTFVGHAWEVFTEKGVLWDAFEIRPDSADVIISDQCRHLDGFGEDSPR